MWFCGENTDDGQGFCDLLIFVIFSVSYMYRELLPACLSMSCHSIRDSSVFVSSSLPVIIVGNIEQ